MRSLWGQRLLSILIFSICISFLAHSSFYLFGIGLGCYCVHSMFINDDLIKEFFFEKKCRAGAVVQR